MAAKAQDYQLIRFEGIPFDLQVQLDRRTLRVRDLLDLKVGSVVPLTRPLGMNFDVLVGGARVGSAEVVVLGDAVAVRLTRIDGGK